MTIQPFTFNPLGVNCYVVQSGDGYATVIDCSCSSESEWEQLRNYFAIDSLDIIHLLNTHLHFDHVWGNGYFYRDFHEKSRALAADHTLYDNIDLQIQSVMGMKIAHPPFPQLGSPLQDGEKLHFGVNSLAVIPTPGHSPGSACFYCESQGVLFSGDTLFRGSCGRTDLEGGNMDDMMKSLKVLSALPDDTKVYCGHGPQTTIGFEKQYNPYLIEAMRR